MRLSCAATTVNGTQAFWSELRPLPTEVARRFGHVRSLTFALSVFKMVGGRGGITPSGEAPPQWGCLTQETLTRPPSHFQCEGGSNEGGVDDSCPRSKMRAAPASWSGARASRPGSLLGDARSAEREPNCTRRSFLRAARGPTRRTRGGFHAPPRDLPHDDFYSSVSGHRQDLTGHLWHWTC